MTNMATRFSAKSVSLAALAAIAALWLGISPATAESAKSWSIADMSGRVNIVRSGAAPVSLATGDELRPGDMIETAADSTVTLVRAGESIRIAPNSRMGLPAEESGAFATLIMQQVGTLLFKVEKQQQPHFEVKTPFLAAVVKGTTFAVSVSSSGASVHVVEGAVQVGDLIGNKGIVRPGQTATVSSAPGGTLSIKGGSATSPAQRADAAVEDTTPAPESEQTVVASVIADPATLATPQSASAEFAITGTIGPVEIDIAAASKGLIQAAQAPGQIAKANPGQGVGAPGASTQVANVGGAVMATSKSAASPLSGGGRLGGTPALSSPIGGGLGGGNPGGAPSLGNPHGGPVAAGHTGILPDVASPAAKAKGLLKKLN